MESLMSLSAPGRSTSVNRVESLRAGTEPFPGYRLTRFLGRGAYGEVWESTRPGKDKVALKFLPCEQSVNATMEVKGLEAIRKLRHRNLLVVDQVWCNAGYIVLSMELAEGSLLDLLGVYLTEMGMPIVPKHLCHFLTQAAYAIDFCNTRQHLIEGRRVAVRHCDIKPSNLLLMPDGSIKVADFTLAVQTTSPMDYHRRAGTLDYTAPEVFQRQLSDRTDQYALAVTYCQLRGNRLPFTDTPPKFERTYIRPAPDLSMLTPEEATIIARALAPVPQNRWPSCVEMMRRLTLCHEG
jgi:serine/threonine protein kinase, bacterial